MSVCLVSLVLDVLVFLVVFVLVLVWLVLPAFVVLLVFVVLCIGVLGGVGVGFAVKGPRGEGGTHTKRRGGTHIASGARYENCGRS